MLPKGTFDDSNSGKTMYTITEANRKMSTVIISDIRNWKNDIELIFNDTGIRPGKEYQVIVEAKGCGGIKKETEEIEINTLGTIIPEIALEMEKFQDVVWKNSSLNIPHTNLTFIVLASR